MDDPLEMDNEILNVLNFKKKKILDVGCGTGNFAFKVAKLLLPYAITKKEKLKQIVNHYTKEEA